MQGRRPVTIVLTVVAYMAATFAVQGLSHFVVNRDFYASLSIMRAEPIVPLGLTSMVVQGLVFGLLFPVFNRGTRSVRNGLLFSWAIGAVLVSYIALGEAGKYAVASIGSWVAVEVSSAAVQFTLFGVLLGLLHRNRAVPNAAPAGA